MKFMFGLQHPLTCKPWTTLSNPGNKVRGKYNYKEVFLRLPSCVLYSCVCYHCVGMHPAYICIFLHESEDDYTTPGSDGNEGVVCFPQSSSITGTSASDCLVSYTGHFLVVVGVLPLCRGAVGVFYSPSRLGNLICKCQTWWFCHSVTFVPGSKSFWKLFPSQSCTVKMNRWTFYLKMWGHIFTQ